MTQVSFALREVDPKLQREALVAMKLQLEETVRQTNQMLALARVDSAGIHPESTNIAPIVEQLTRAWWQSAREKGIDLGYESEISNLIVDVQPGMLKEAITNLLHNAISYTPLGGHITVRLSRNATQARISVIDDGPGISEQDLAHVGERFFKTTLSTQTSTGLGLAITRSIAERHGGMLELGVGDRWQGLSASIVLPLT
jgi:two-component system sensor histidine kinase TctE